MISGSLQGVTVQHRSRLNDKMRIEFISLCANPKGILGNDVNLVFISSLRFETINLFTCSECAQHNIRAHCFRPSEHASSRRYSSTQSRHNIRTPAMTLHSRTRTGTVYKGNDFKDIAYSARSGSSPAMLTCYSHGAVFSQQS